jgi:23S rRNA pseudouridine1911/1915/1917 synthase
MRLDLLLIERHPGLSRRKAREVIENGQVTLDGALVQEAGRDVPAGADVSWDPHRKARRHVRTSIPILFEDAHLIVVDKPAGLLTVPTEGGGRGEDTALGRVRDYVRHLRPRTPYVGRVHRIDRDTSGAVAFALDPATREALIQLFKAHAIERRYLALVSGVPAAGEGRIDAPIHDEYEGGRRRIARAGEPGRPARTRFTVEKPLGRASLVALRLETGRQHQIRLHLAHRGHPILGDAVYGNGRAVPGVRVPRLMLHAAHLGFDHPETGTPVRVDSPLPEDFADVLKELARRKPR